MKFSAHSILVAFVWFSLLNTQLDPEPFIESKKGDNK